MLNRGLEFRSLTTFRLCFMEGFHIYLSCEKETSLKVLKNEENSRNIKQHQRIIGPNSRIHTASTIEMDSGERGWTKRFDGKLWNNWRQSAISKKLFHRYCLWYWENISDIFNVMLFFLSFRNIFGLDVSCSRVFRQGRATMFFVNTATFWVSALMYSQSAV